MKTLLVTLIKSAVWALILLASALMLLVIYSDKPWDPIGQIQHFNHQHRRDDALDLIRFLKANSTYNTDELTALEKQIAISTTEKTKALLWDGAVKGQVYDTFSGIGAMAADFCIYGDVRDIMVQSFNLLFDQDNFDGIVSALSGIGIALSTMPLFSATSAFNKNTAKYVAKLPAGMNQGMLKTFLSGNASPKQSRAIFDLLKKTDGPFPEPHPACQMSITQAT